MVDVTRDAKLRLEMESKGEDKLEKAEELLQKTAESAKKVAPAGKAAAEGLESVGGSAGELDKINDLLRDLDKNLGELDTESREGLSSFADRAGKATQRINELNSRVEKLGSKATPELRRELKRLEGQFEQTFDEGKRRAAQTEAAIENVEDQVKILKRESRGGTEGIFDLTEAINLQFPKASKAIGGTVAAIGTFGAAFGATRKALDFFEQHFNLSWDRMLQNSEKFQRVANVFIDVGDAAKASGNELEIQRRRLEQLGKEDQFSTNVEKNAEALRMFAHETQQASELLSRFGVVSDENVAKAEEFAKRFERALELEDLDTEVLRERFGKEVQQLLDNLIASAEEVPPAFQSIVDKLNVLPSAVERANAETEKRLGQLAQRLGLKEEKVNVEQAVSDIQTLLGRIGEIDESQNEAVRDHVQTLVDEVRAAGEMIGSDLGKLADQFDVPTRAMERIGHQASIVPDATRTLADELDFLAGRARSTGPDLKSVADASRLEGAEEGATKVSELGEQAGAAADQLDRVKKGAGEAAPEIEGGGTVAGDAAKKVESLASAAAKLGEAQSGIQAQAPGVQSAIEQWAAPVEATASSIAALNGVDLTGFVGELDKVKEKLGEVLAVSTELEGSIERVGGGGGGAAPGVPGAAGGSESVTVDLGGG